MDSNHYHVESTDFRCPTKGVGPDVSGLSPDRLMNGQIIFIRNSSSYEQGYGTGGSRTLMSATSIGAFCVLAVFSRVVSVYQFRHRPRNGCFAVSGEPPRQ